MNCNDEPVAEEHHAGVAGGEEQSRAVSPDLSAPSAEVDREIARMARLGAYL